MQRLAAPDGRRAHYAHLTPVTSNRGDTIRIALIHSYYDERTPSGENVVVDAQAAALRRAGHDVRIFARRTRELRDDALYEVRAALRVASRRGPGPVGLADFAPDIVHVHNLFPNFGRTWVDDVDAPLVATLHNYRSVCSQPMLLRDGQPCTLCVDGSRWSALRHRCFRDSVARTMPLVLSQRGGPLADPVIAGAAVVLVMNATMQDVLARAGVPRDRMEVAPSFLAAEDTPSRVASGVSDSWLFVGRFGVEKGILRLLERWPIGHRLSVVGAGGEDEEAVRQIATGRSDIDLLGALPRDEVLGLMQRSRGLVFPSTWYEGSPLVIAEALACGLPILAFHPTDVSTQVERRGIGRRVSWDDDLEAVLDDAGGTFAMMRDDCREYFARESSEAAFVARTERLYERLVS